MNSVTMLTSGPMDCHGQIARVVGCRKHKFGQLALKLIERALFGLTIATPGAITIAGGSMTLHPQSL